TLNRVCDGLILRGTKRVIIPNILIELRSLFGMAEQRNSLPISARDI
ncbi:5421_t:CDS:2, partial [Funneliformis geosporum]